jgi:hypothetical protein
LSFDLKKRQGFDRREKLAGMLWLEHAFFEGKPLREIPKAGQKQFPAALDLHGL